MTYTNPDHKENTLVRLLRTAGWTNTYFDSSTLHYCKQFRCPLRGTVTYTAQIIGKTLSQTSFTDMQLCRLLGPSINSRTGTYAPNETLGEWKTDSGAQKGILPCFNKARKEFLEKNKKIIESKTP